MKQLFRRLSQPVRGLFPMEIVVLCYLLLTLIVMLCIGPRLTNVSEMLLLRARVVLMMAVMWALYRLAPCRATAFLRIAVQMLFLIDWYPDTYEFNRCFNNLDHVFCALEGQLFGCQPALLFSKYVPWYVVSELLDMGYAAYYPIIMVTTVYYFLCQDKLFQRAVFTIMGAFLLMYVVFLFVPVAGPTFYYCAVGQDVVAQGVYPVLGDYFNSHSDLSIDCLPSPGWEQGPMWKLVELAKWSGERPTAAFPSSHVGLTVVCMLLLWYSKNRKVFYSVLPFAILMFFATVYIQAHYLIDAIAGLISGTLLFAALWYGYPLLTHPPRRTTR